jgi:hypothetical protein
MTPLGISSFVARPVSAVVPGYGVAAISVAVALGTALNLILIPRRYEFGICRALMQSEVEMPRLF